MLGCVVKHRFKFCTLHSFQRFWRKGHCFVCCLGEVVSLPLCLFCKCLALWNTRFSPGSIMFNNWVRTSEMFKVLYILKELLLLPMLLSIIVFSNFSFKMSPCMGVYFKINGDFTYEKYKNKYWRNNVFKGPDSNTEFCDRINLVELTGLILTVFF